MRVPSPKPIIVGVHGSAAGLAAVRLGAREAVVRGQPLRVVHAFSWPGPRFADDFPDWATARREAAHIVEDAVATAERTVPGVRVHGEVVDGAAARELLRLSHTGELIVLGDDDLASSPRLPVTSVLVQTVSRARCPVVIARGIRPPAGPVIVGFDGSPAARRALLYGAAEARRRRAAFEVVHVVPDDASVAAGRQLLKESVAEIPEAEIRVLVGDPAPTLVRVSRRGRIMIVGPTGRGRAGLLGSSALELLRRCASPTVFVHGTLAEQRAPGGTVPTAGALIG
jgi:nucleotide-binding universal stress UspA family protein